MISDAISDLVLLNHFTRKMIVSVDLSLFFCTRQTGCGLYMTYSIIFTEITFNPESSVLLQII